MLEVLSNVQAEQAVLGSILFDHDGPELTQKLKPSDFGTPEHSEIFYWIEREMEAGRKPTPGAIIAVLRNMRCGEIDGATYITRLNRMVDRTTASSHLALVKELAARRAMLGIADALHANAREPDLLPRNTALEAIGWLNDAMGYEHRGSLPPQSVVDVAKDLIADLGETGDRSLVSTGLQTLDRFLGGWPRGELSIVAGRPSMGKSAVLSAMARRGAKQGLNILIFSLEMPRAALVARMLSDFAYSRTPGEQIPYADIIRKTLSEAQRQKLCRSLEVFQTYPITIDDQRGLTMAEIRTRSLRFADALSRQGQTLDIIMVDHIGKIGAGDRYRGNMVHETGEKSDALMNLAYAANAAVVAAHQLNRNTEGREDKHPTPADLRDTGNLEQDAHTLVFPYRQSYYLERQKFDDPEKDKIRQATLEKKRNTLELLVAKCRNGAVGSLDVYVDIASNHVEDMLIERQREAS